MTLPQLVADHDGPRVIHTLWCREHVNYDPVNSPADGCCTMPFDLDFVSVARNTDDARTATVDLWFAALGADEETEKTAYIGFDGSEHDTHGLQPWKLVPLAYAMLAAEAQSRGASEQAQAFMAIARDAISAHLAEVAA